MNPDTLAPERTLSTADIAAAPERAANHRDDAAQLRDRGDRGTPDDRAPDRDEELAALFTHEAANDFRTRWNDLQSGFVDDPRSAVQRADELVAQVMKNLAESFAAERSRFEEGLRSADEGAATEQLRLALRRYRSFFERLLSL